MGNQCVKLGRWGCKTDLQKSIVQHWANVDHCGDRICGNQPMLTALGANMELKAAIFADFDAYRVAPGTPPQFKKYNNIVQNMDAADVERLAALLQTESPPWIPHGYMQYLSLYMSKEVATLRLREHTQSNLCTICFENLGPQNPRVYCCKTHCPHE